MTWRKKPPKLPDQRGDFDLWSDYPLKTGIPAHELRLWTGNRWAIRTSRVVGAFLTVVLFVIELIGVDVVAFVMVLIRLQIIVSLAFVVVLEAVFVIVAVFLTVVLEAVFVIVAVFLAVVLEAVFVIIIASAVVFVIIAFAAAAIATLVIVVRTRHLENDTLDLSEVVQDLHRYIKVVVRKRRYRE